MESCQKVERHEILYQNRYNIGITGYPLSLLSKGENVQSLPSRPMGEIVGKFGLQLSLMSKEFMNDKGITNGYDGKTKSMKDIRNMMAQLRMWHDTYDDMEYDGVLMMMKY